jgi:hypothetical protein
MLYYVRLYRNGPDLQRELEALRRELAEHRSQQNAATRMQVNQPLEQDRTMENMEGRLQAQEIFWKQKMRSLEQRLEQERQEMEQRIANLSQSLEEERKQRRKERKRRKKREKKKKAVKEEKEKINTNEKEEKIGEELRGVDMKEAATIRLNGRGEIDQQDVEIDPSRQKHVEMVQVC